MLAALALAGLAACTNDYDLVQGTAASSGAASSASAASTGSGGAGATGTGGGGDAGGQGPGGATSTGGAGAAGGGPVASAVCAGAPSDTFDGAPLDPQWGSYDMFPSVLELDDDRLEVEVGSAIGPRFAGLYSTAKFTFSECHVLAHVGVLPADVDGTVYLQVLQPPEMQPQLAAELVVGPFLQPGELAVASGKYYNNTTQQLAGGPTVPYDDTLQWWRIRHTAGEVHMEIGANAQGPFTVLSTIPDDDFTGPVQLAFGAGTSSEDSDAVEQEAWFDDVNLP